MAFTGLSTSVAREPGFPILLGPELDSESTSLFELDPDLESDMRKKSRGPAGVPSHPIPSMQDAFAESLIEATNIPTAQKPKLRTGDAKARRQLLLDQAKEDGPPAAEWRFRPGQRNHELRKLMAQISFGVYLLLNGMANSNTSVVSILQGHIDEVDEFLETTMEDVELATTDITGRIDYLKLPLDNMALFEQMLEDREFRLRIVEGNVNIEHILCRTSTALSQSTEDITQGLSSTKEFTLYLAGQQNGKWRQDRPDVIDIFEAMKGNTEGWYNAFVDLRAKSDTLNGLLVKLNGIVSEIDRRAGEVSRRTRFSIQPFTIPSHSRHSSGSSSQTTPRASPPVSRRQHSPPPRLSLKLGSDIGGSLTDSAYFDIPTPKDMLPSIQFSPIQEDSADDSTEIGGGRRDPADARPELESKPEPDSAPELDSEPEPELEPEPKSPETALLAESAADEEGPLYILQPRTYTPLPPAPEPSPRIIDNRPEQRFSPSITERPMPRIPPINVDRPASKSPPLEHKRDPSREGSISTLRAISKPTAVPTPKSPETEQPKKRTSLRQRVSLKTNPPESILVPPPGAVELQRPIYSSPKYQAPDSAYGSDIERSNVRSTAEPALSPPPRIRPTLVPSPHSDQQYFRPVQASPHSPLQQRPHTAGTVRQQAYQQHQRNVPSRMGGMSMLSNVTTLNPDAPDGRTLKKKRSAFGWLKKAFSLDDEERAAFEQRKIEQSRNLYYDGRSPKFLDGRRIR